MNADAAIQDVVNTAVVDNEDNIADESRIEGVENADASIQDVINTAVVNADAAIQGVVNTAEVPVDQDQNVTNNAAPNITDVIQGDANAEEVVENPNVINNAEEVVDDQNQDIINNAAVADNEDNIADESRIEGVENADAVIQGVVNTAVVNADAAIQDVVNTAVVNNEENDFNLYKQREIKRMTNVYNDFKASVLLLQDTIIKKLKNIILLENEKYKIKLNDELRGGLSIRDTVIREIQNHIIIVDSAYENLQNTYIDILDNNEFNEKITTFNILILSKDVEIRNIEQELTVKINNNYLEILGGIEDKIIYLEKEKIEEINKYPNFEQKIKEYYGKIKKDIITQIISFLDLYLDDNFDIFENGQIEYNRIIKNLIDRFKEKITIENALWDGNMFIDKKKLEIERRFDYISDTYRKQEINNITDIRALYDIKTIENNEMIKIGGFEKTAELKTLYSVFYSKIQNLFTITKNKIENEKEIMNNYFVGLNNNEDIDYSRNFILFEDTYPSIYKTYNEIVNVAIKEFDINIKNNTAILNENINNLKDQIINTNYRIRNNIKELIRNYVEKIRTIDIIETKTEIDYSEYENFLNIVYEYRDKYLEEIIDKENDIEINIYELFSIKYYEILTDIENLYNLKIQNIYLDINNIINTKNNSNNILQEYITETEFKNITIKHNIDRSIIDSLIVKWNNIFSKIIGRILKINKDILEDINAKTTDEISNIKRIYDTTIVKINNDEEELINELKSTYHQQNKILPNISLNKKGGAEKYIDIRTYFNGKRLRLENFVEKIFKDIDNEKEKYINSIKIEGEEYVSFEKYKKKGFLNSFQLLFVDELNNYIEDQITIPFENTFKNYFIEIYIKTIEKIRKYIQTKMVGIENIYNVLLEGLKNDVTRNNILKEIPITNTTLIEEIWNRENEKIKEIKINNIDLNYNALLNDTIDTINNMIRYINNSPDIIENDYIDTYFKTIDDNIKKDFNNRVLKDINGEISKQIKENNIKIELLIKLVKNVEEIVENKKNTLLLTYDSVKKTIKNNEDILQKLNNKYFNSNNDILLNNNILFNRIESVENYNLPIKNFEDLINKLEKNINIIITDIEVDWDNYIINLKTEIKQYDDEKKARQEEILGEIDNNVKTKKDIIKEIFDDENISITNFEDILIERINKYSKDNITLRYPNETEILDEMIGGEKYNDIKQYFNEWREELKNNYEQINSSIDNDKNIYISLIKNPGEEYISEDKYNENKLSIEKYPNILLEFINYKKDNYNFQIYIDKYINIIKEISKKFTDKMKNAIKKYNKIFIKVKTEINKKTIPEELSYNYILEGIWNRENYKIVDIKRKNIDKNYIELYISIINEINTYLIEEEKNKSPFEISMDENDIETNIDKIIKKIYGNTKDFVKKLLTHDEERFKEIKEVQEKHDIIIKELISLIKNVNEIIKDKKKVITLKYEELFQNKSVISILDISYRSIIDSIDRVYNNFLESVEIEENYNLNITEFKKIMSSYVDKIKEDIDSITIEWNKNVSSIEIEINKYKKDIIKKNKEILDEIDGYISVLKDDIRARIAKKKLSIINTESKIISDLENKYIVENKKLTCPNEIIGGEKKYHDIKETFEKFIKELDTFEIKIYDEIDKYKNLYIDSIILPGEEYVSTEEYNKNPFSEKIKKYYDDLNNFIENKNTQYLGKEYIAYVGKYTSFIEDKIKEIQEKITYKMRVMTEKYNIIFNKLEQKINNNTIPVELNNNEILESIWNKINNKNLEIKKKNINSNYKKLYCEIIIEINKIIDNINNSPDIIESQNINIDEVIEKIYGKTDIGFENKLLTFDKDGVAEVKEADKQYIFVINLLINLIVLIKNYIKEKKNDIDIVYQENLNKIRKNGDIRKKLIDLYKETIKNIDDIYNELLQSILRENNYTKEIIDGFNSNSQENINTVDDNWKNNIEIIEEEIKEYELEETRKRVISEQEVEDIYIDNKENELQVINDANIKSEDDTLIEENNKKNEKKTQIENKRRTTIEKNINDYTNKDIPFDSSELKKIIDKISKEECNYLLFDIYNKLKEIPNMSKDKKNASISYIEPMINKLTTDINDLIVMLNSRNKIIREKFKQKLDKYVTEKITEINKVNINELNKQNFEILINNINAIIANINTNNLDFDNYISRFERVKNKLIIKKFMIFHNYIEYYKHIKEKIPPYDDEQLLEKMKKYYTRKNNVVIDGIDAITTIKNFVDKLYNNIEFIKGILTITNDFIENDLTYLYNNVSTRYYRPSIGFGGSKKSLKKYKIIKKS